MSSQTAQAGGKAHLFTDKDKARIQKTQQVDGQIKKDSFPARVQSTVDSRNALNNPGTATGGNAAK
ncbi:hypothetical protein WOLCODRAFT_155564 [Wolfiporia cocos MD-104 SS10]|uniref:Uncharacterized protein n=1 Tax=Wolfiporia cocos (strain MD-104) TaxID=742152 RepID=A0A2H3IYV7_WOLCO|nr:hypothetical protein WOLCODRAFT_155564 [Wolfiporia cocos MD-104 SS10]